MDDFDGFVRAHWTRLHAIVSRTARRYQLEPDDALQEALLRAYAGREAFESDQHAVNWICRVARDLLCDQRRSWYCRRVSASAEPPEVGTAPDPADALVARDTRRELRLALAVVPPAHRLLLWQHAVDGRSYADIAREAACPLATVRSHALRARLAARRHLRGEASPGLVAAFGLRVRAFRARCLPAANDAAAALLAFGLAVSGGAGQASAGRTHAPAAALPVVRAVPALPQLPAPQPATPASAVTHAVTADHTPPPAAPVPAPDAGEFTMAAFNGDRWGECAMTGATTPFAHPLVSIGAPYACDLAAESTTCTVFDGASTSSSRDCSFSLRASIAGEATGLPGTASRCDTDARRTGTVTFRISGRARPYVVRVELRIEFVCDGGTVDRARVLSGRVTPAP